MIGDGRDAGAAEEGMTKKTVVALLIVLAGMFWVYQSFASGTKTTDLILLDWGMVMMFQGLKELLEDHHAAATQGVTLIRNVCIVLMFVGLGWQLLH
jgi:hypothetical protein